MRLNFLLALGVIAIGIYIMPNVIATFHGAHTLEVNETAGKMGLRCTECHGYILEEITASESSSVLQAHRDAAGNVSYTRGWLNLTIDNSTDYGVCHLCHLSKIQMIGSHTQIVVRACTDLDCHGTNASTNNTAYINAGRVGPYLGNVSNVHGNLFESMSNYASNYKNESGIAYSKSYWACLGCHTETQVDINVTEGTFAHTDQYAAKKRYL